ncbi:MAG: hypothetical protein K2X49_26240 [Acetobacteraceae bacterium]|nr:hypothetical protein [Acetobacteraceae bacterium]
MSDEFRVPTGDGDRLIHDFAPASQDDWKALTRGLERRVHGVFASRKMQASIPWRNRAERDLMVLLEADGRVLGYEHLTDRITLSTGGKARVHYPSFRVRTATGRVLVDVFRVAPGRRGADHPIAQMVARACEQTGRAYRALSEAEVHLRPRFDNARHVLGYRRMTPDPATVLRVTEVLSRRSGTATVRQIAADLPDEPQAAGTVFAMALRSIVCLDMSAVDPLDMRATLRARGLS